MAPGVDRLALNRRVVAETESSVGGGRGRRGGGLVLDRRRLLTFRISSTHCTSFDRVWKGGEEETGLDSVAPNREVVA